MNSDYFVNLVVLKHPEQLTPLSFALSVYKSGWYTDEPKAILVFPEHAMSLTYFAFQLFWNMPELFKSLLDILFPSFFFSLLSCHPLPQLKQLPLIIFNKHCPGKGFRKTTVQPGVNTYQHTLPCWQGLLKTSVG